MPPKPPPQAVGTMRTALGRQPHHVARPRRGPCRASACGRGSRCGRRRAAPSRPRARYRRARRSRSRTCLRRRRRRLRSAARRRRRASTRPSSSTLSGLSACTSGASAASAASTPDHRRLRLPGDRHLVVADRLDRRRARRPGRARLAAIAHLPVGQHRLVLDVGIDAEAVERHVGRGQHAPGRDARRRASRSPSVKRARAWGERTTRSHSASAGHGVGAVDVAAPSTLACAVDAGDAGADGFAGRRRGRAAPVRRRPAPPRRSCGSRCSGRARRRARPRPRRSLGLAVARSEVVRRHQHARRADAALGRAMVEERRAAAQRRVALLRQALDRRRSCDRRPARPATRQEQTCRPSSSTVQAPQSPASQPILVPVDAEIVAQGRAPDAWPARRRQSVLSRPLRRELRCFTPPPPTSEHGRSRTRAHARCDSRRWRAHRRSATAARDGGGSTRSPRCASTGAPTSVASRSGRRCATGEQAPTAIRARRDLFDPLTSIDDRGHGDRDHEIAARARA